MRSISTTLTNAQKNSDSQPRWKVILSRTAQSTRGYDYTRIIKQSLTETPQGDACELILNNSDNALTALDLENYQAMLSWGYYTGITPASWVSNSTYAVGDYIKPTSPNGYQYRCTVAGTSGLGPETLRPNAAGDVTELTASAGSNYECVDEVTADDDTTYVEGVSAGGGSALDKYDLYNLPAHSSSWNISKITVYFRCRYTIAGTGRLAYAKIKTGGTEYTGDANTMTQDYQTFSQEWATNPNTGIAWTWSDIDALQIGVRLVVGSQEFVAVEARCTQVYVVVTAEPPDWPTDLGVTVADSSVTWEMDGNQGEEYSACAPLRVRSWELHSGRGILKCIIRPTGILNQMGEDAATAAYTTTAADTATVQTQLNLVVSGGLAPYSAYTGYTLQVDSSDTIFTTHKPGDYFNVKMNETRLDKYSELLGYTASKGRIENDGEVHIIKPVVSGTAYDYEYKFNTRAEVGWEHTFFAKTARQRFVNPNKEVVTSATSAGTVFSGTATSDTSYYLAKKIHTTVTNLPSNAVAASIAAAKIEQYELDADKGIITVPMNVAQELWDYVKVTDTRLLEAGTSTTRIGNVQYINRIAEIHPNTNQAATWQMTIAFGKPSQLGLMAAMSDTGISEGKAYWSAEAITEQFQSIIDVLADMSQGMTWQREETFVVEESIPGSLDDISDGTTYSRVLTTSITAGNIILSSVVMSSTSRYVTGANTTSWTGKPDDMDDIPTGATYGKLLATNLSAGNIKVTSDAYFEGDWYYNTGVEINASTGITIYGGAGTVAFRAMSAYGSGTTQVYIGTDGKLYAGAGAVRLDANGLFIDGEVLDFGVGSTILTMMGVAGSTFSIVTVGASAGIYLNTGSGGVHITKLNTAASVLASTARVLGTIYQNSSGHPKLVNISVGIGDAGGGDVGRVRADIGSGTPPTTAVALVGDVCQLTQISFFVPLNYYYRLVETAGLGTNSLQYWTETEIGDTTWS